MKKLFKFFLNLIPRPWLISASYWVRPVVAWWYRGDRSLIGISVFGSDQMPTQLEFYSIDGLANNLSIPELSTLERVSSK